MRNGGDGREGDGYHDDVQDVPQVCEVGQPPPLHLDPLLDDVVEEEAAEEELAGEHEVVEVRHVADQLHRLEVGGGEHAARGRKLEHDPEVFVRIRKNGPIVLSLT